MNTCSSRLERQFSVADPVRSPSFAQCPARCPKHSHRSSHAPDIRRKGRDIARKRGSRNLEEKFSAEEFVVLAEMNAPRGVDTTQFLMNARRIRGRVDAVAVPDMENGIMRMSALAGGVLIQQEGMDSVIHVCCRDRNRVALQGDILAAHALGIQNLIVGSGAGPHHGGQPESRSVNDLDEIGLLKAISCLEQGTDLGGADLDGAPNFTVGCTMNPWSNDEALSRELDLTARKVDAGARFVVTPPVFDADRFEIFIEDTLDLGVPILPTVVLLNSFESARELAAANPGVGLEEEMITRIRDASDPELECIQIAGEIVAAVKEFSSGVRIIASGKEHRIRSVLDFAGL